MCLHLALYTVKNVIINCSSFYPKLKRILNNYSLTICCTLGSSPILPDVSRHVRYTIRSSLGRASDGVCLCECQSVVVFGREFYLPFSALLHFVLAVGVLEVMGILCCRCAKVLEHQAVDLSEERVC